VTRQPFAHPRLSTGGVGLYLNPPERAVALCVDEKSQIQALDRIQPFAAAAARPARAADS
jgi:hypothetical protein